MTDTRRVVLDAFVTPVELPMILSAGEGLQDSLVRAAGAPWQVEVRRCDEPDTATGTILITSLLREATSSTSLVEIEGRWRALLLTAEARYHSRFVCTVFRHVASADADPELRERIRRINLLALTLSQGTGAGVIDIDRSLAHVGGAVLGTDFTLYGDAAARAVAHVITAAILAVGIDGLVADDALARARRAHGKMPMPGARAASAAPDRDRASVDVA